MAAISSLQADSGLRIEMRQSKDLKNIVEQSHRAVKRITRPMLGLKSFRCARILIAGFRAAVVAFLNCRQEPRAGALCL